VAGSIFDGVAMALNSEEASFVDTLVSYLDCYLIFKAQTDFSDGEAQSSLSRKTTPSLRDHIHIFSFPSTLQLQACAKGSYIFP
jgi:hypothetical protein